jgi:hypothetical protein
MRQCQWTDVRESDMCWTTVNDAAEGPDREQFMISQNSLFGYHGGPPFGAIWGMSLI